MKINFKWLELLLFILEVRELFLVKLFQHVDGHFKFLVQ